MCAPAPAEQAGCEAAEPRSAATRCQALTRCRCHRQAGRPTRARRRTRPACRTPQTPRAAPSRQGRQGPCLLCAVVFAPHLVQPAIYMRGQHLQQRAVEQMAVELSAVMSWLTATARSLGKEAGAQRGGICNAQRCTAHVTQQISAPGLGLPPGSAAGALPPAAPSRWPQREGCSRRERGRPGWRPAAQAVL